MSGSPAISVAMSVYNGMPWLNEAIESILAQSFGDFEFLILNDGSKDASLDVITDYAARDPRIRIISRENRGLIASLNELVAEARAPIIARMDADDIALPERFARQHEFLVDHPDYGVVGSWARDIDEAGNAIQLKGHDQPTSHTAFLQAIPAKPLMCHSSSMIRRACLERVGGYHAAFRHCEDYDLWLRLAGLTKLCSLPQRLILYRHSAGQISNRHLVEQQLNAAISWVAWRERQEGRPDPTAMLDRLPALDDIDRLFGRPGVLQEVRERAARAILYSPTALMSDDGFALVRGLADRGGRSLSLWRTVARLGVRMNEWGRAAQLARALLS